MPAATTHAEFAREWKNTLPLDEQKKIANPNMFYLGAQGPDLFFFSDAGMGKKTLRNYGSLMHQQSPFETLKFMNRYAGEDPDLISYIYGYISHYALDSCAHPLIFYDARFMGDSQDTETVRHFRVEAIIDRIMLQKNGRDISDYDTDILTALSEKDIRKLSGMYVHLFEEVFNWQLSQRKIEQTCRQCSFFLRVLRPNSERKFRMIAAVEKLAGAPHMISSLMLYNRMDHEDELLNLNHQTFENVHNAEMKSSASFFDCWQEALKKASALAHVPDDRSLYACTYDGTVRK